MPAIPAAIAPFIDQAVMLTIFVTLALLVRWRAELRVRAYFANEGVVLRVRRIGAPSIVFERNRPREFRVQVRRPDGMVVTHAAELSAWSPVRRLW